MRNKRLGGFTLIELLIVVAIITILAAIAVPNFLEAQTRAKVSRAKADMRSFATALEAYRVDNNTFPAGNRMSYALRLYDAYPPHIVLERITTPIAYFTSASISDPFVRNRNHMLYAAITMRPELTVPVPEPERENSRFYSYATFGLDDSPSTGELEPCAILVEDGDSAKWCFVLYSAGPDLASGPFYPMIASMNSFMSPKISVPNLIYDPSNGTVSEGNIYRLGGGNPSGCMDDLIFRTFMHYQSK